MPQTKSQKFKSKKLAKLIDKSDSEDDNNLHELSYYIDDRVKMMKEILKILKPKKIKSMAPDCIKHLDMEEISSMLLEELLGISNKRLKYIMNGQNLDEDSSSTDPEDDKEPIDIISLDDVSDDEFIIDVDALENTSKHKKSLKIKHEPKTKKIKKEKIDKNKAPLQEENLMSVLELLELQARARAIRSQLALEASKKAEDNPQETENDDVLEVDELAIIVESPKNNEEIIISSSDSENETTASTSEMVTKSKKITLNRQRFRSQSNGEDSECRNEASIAIDLDKNVTADEETVKSRQDNDAPDKCIDDSDEIVINVDQAEMAGIDM